MQGQHEYYSLWAGHRDKTGSPDRYTVVSTIMTNQNLSEPANGKEHPDEQEELDEGDEDALADVAASGVLDKISSDSR